MTKQWSVAADDRTGAFEVAALLATTMGEGPVLVTVGAPAATPAAEGAPAAVVDLQTRALPIDEARRAVAHLEPTDGWAGHKIDSTLRGNWAAELRARRQAGGRRVIVLAGWPDLGRTCVHGVVRLFDEPVGDLRQHLPEASLVPHAAGLAAWWRSGGGIAACDVPDNEAMHALAAVIAGFAADEVLVAGPAGPLAAVAAAGLRRAAAPPPRPSVRGTALVVCGSANITSHRQIERLRMARPHLEVVAAPSPTAGGTDDGEIELSLGPALAVAQQARARLAALQPETVVIIGGDTAAAVLGDAPRRVGGMIAPGMPWSRDEHDGGPLVITKAGGFGGLNALSDLFAGDTG
ncbi:MAG: four-carbon acid sugar kinase family protein [Actinomycetota bacterium]|nr:four-carbon acid sugar kinase family protein [Actinomycetota bacterium]